jgi:hypothetical protein
MIDFGPRELRGGMAYAAVLSEDRLDMAVRNITTSGAADGESLSARVIRGSRCGSKGETLHEFAAALQFPWYFGHNWDALDECLRDMAVGELPQATVIVTRVGDILPKDESGFRTLLEILFGAVDEGLSVVFCTEAADDLRRLGHYQDRLIMLDLARLDASRSGGAPNDHEG